MWPLRAMLSRHSKAADADDPPRVLLLLTSGILRVTAGRPRKQERGERPAAQSRFVPTDSVAARLADARSAAKGGVRPTVGRAVLAPRRVQVARRGRDPELRSRVRTPPPLDLTLL